MMKKIIISMICLLFVFLIVLGVIVLVDQIKTDTMPQIEESKVEDFATNIVNSILNNEEAAVPNSLLTGIVNDITEDKTVCMVTGSDMIDIWVDKKLDLFGETVIHAGLEFENYDKDTGKITFRLKDIRLGTLKIPDYFRQTIIDEIKKQAGNNVEIEEDEISFRVKTYTVTFLHTDITVGLDSVSMHDGAIWFKLYSETSLNYR
jgi:uncharacterized protein YpmS